MADQRKRDEYTKDRFVWLDQVMADRELPASASKVAYVIATSLWRQKGTVTLVTPQITASDHVREAWIGTREIANKIGMSRFTVMTMVRRLEKRGHLEVDPGKQGRGHANHYRLVKKGAPANPLEGKEAKLKGAHNSLLEGAQAKPKGAPANLLDGEKVSRRTSRGAPTHLRMGHARYLGATSLSTKQFCGGTAPDAARYSVARFRFGAFASMADVDTEINGRRQKAK